MNDPAPIDAEPNPPSIAPLPTMTPMFSAGFVMPWKSIAIRLSIWLVTLVAGTVIMLMIIARMGNRFELISMVVAGVGSGGIFSCGLLLAYGPGFLALRCVGIILAQTLFLSTLVLVGGGAPGLPELQRILFVICMVPIAQGVLLTLAKFCGYTLQRPAAISGRQTKVAQFSIGKLIELTAIAAVMFALLRVLENQAEVFEIFWVVGLVTLGQGVPALLLLVPHYSAAFRYGMMIGLWAPLLAGHLYALMTMFSYSNFQTTIEVLVLHILAANITGVTCFVLRARGYRLMHVDSRAV